LASSSPLNRFLSTLFSSIFRRRTDASPSVGDDHAAIFSSPETLSAYFARLDVATLPFAIDAARLIAVVPPLRDGEYVVLDNACGTGAAVEWTVKQFQDADVPLDITATDYSAVMMNEVELRRERLHWESDVKSFIMDAQVTLLKMMKLTLEFNISSEFIYACLYEFCNNVDTRL